MSIHVLTGIRSGAKVLVDGMPYEAAAQVVDHIVRARAASFSVFSLTDRTVALRRLKYVQAVHELVPHLRHRKDELAKCAERVFGELRDAANTIAPDMDADEQAETASDADREIKTTAEAVRDKLMARIEGDMQNGAPAPVEAPPSARNVRKWYRLYYASGQDVRVLLDLHCLKGNRKDRYPAWVKNSVEKIIDSAIAVPTPSRYTHAWNLACEEVRRNSDEIERPLPDIAKLRGGTALLGKNLLSRWVARRDQFKLAVRQIGVYEARRRFSVVELGPQGDHPNHQWETDHTLLDVFVVDELRGKAYGRPWLTVMMDRFSRCITGYSLSFAPPSWVAIMDTMRVAIAPKDDILKALCAGKHKIDKTWDCFGIPDSLITDHGREFKSQSLDETLAVLNTKPFQVKKRKPWLKGKIERWFGTLEDVIHTIPGTTFSKFYQREFYQSEKFAVMTLPQLNFLVAKWIVDVYHQKKHSKLKCAPIDMWLDGVVVHKPPRKLPDSLLQPLMGLVVNRSLRKGGVKYLGLRWDSQAFALLRGRLPEKGADVMIRIDPRDLNTAFAWDEKNNEWVVGHLKEPVEAGKYSLDQWFFIDFNRKENMEAGMNRQAAINKAIADIDDFIAGIQQGYTNTKAYKRYLEFTTAGSSAWVHVRNAYSANDDSPPGSHKIGDMEIKNPPPAKSGPYSESRRPAIQRGNAEEDKATDGAAGGTHEALAAPSSDTNGDETVAGGETDPNAVSQKDDGPVAVEEIVPVKGITTPKAVVDPDEDFKDDDFSGPFTARRRAILEGESNA